MKLQTLKPIIQTIKSAVAVMNPDSWRTDKQTSAQRGYGYKWQQAREGFLRKHPLCVYCEREGRIKAASVVDHKIPHRGNMEVFWDSEQWQSLCSTCHSSVKAIEEREAGLR